VTHLTINGSVTIDRKVYWSKATGSVYPSDRFLGIAQHSVSPGVREMCCLVSLDSSFTRVARSLKQTAQLTLSEDRIRRVVEAEGQTVIRAQSSGVLAASFTAEDCADGVMVTGTDGVFVPVVPETQKARRRATEAKKRKKEGRRSTRRPGRPKRGADGDYKEAKILAFYNQDKSKTHVVATLGDCNELGKLMRREGRKVKLDDAKFSYSVADGATWKASQAVYGEDSPKASIWQEKMLGAAWEQGSLVMLHRLWPYVRRHTCERREALASLRSYVESRTSNTDYPHFREQGYDCGSGPTESQCGTLTDRVKGAGMRWDADNAASMMVLSALDHSQQWNAYWKLQRAA